MTTAILSPGRDMYLEPLLRRDSVLSATGPRHVSKVGLSWHDQAAMAGTVTYEFTEVRNASKRIVYNYTVHAGTYSNTIFGSSDANVQMSTHLRAQCIISVLCAVSKTPKLLDQNILRRFKLEGFTVQQTDAQLCLCACRNWQFLRTANSMVFTTRLWMLGHDNKI
jgi:hypothetical protein